MTIGGASAAATGRTAEGVENKEGKDDGTGGDAYGTDGGRRHGIHGRTNGDGGAGTAFYPRINRM
jgi:hypothetical protein